MQPEGSIDEPTDHPHVFKERAPPLNGEDEDIQRYILSFDGAGGAVTFFAGVLKDRINEDLYRYYENTPDSKPSFSGITADNIDEVINIFDSVVNDVGEIKIVGEIDGEEWSMEVWDGEVTERDYLSAESK